MRFRSLFCPAVRSTVLLSALTATVFALEIPADDRRIVYEGRTQVTADHRMRLGYPGIAVHLRASARSLALHANASSDTVYFDVIVDGAAPALWHVPKGEAVTPLYHALPNGEHRVELIRRTESWEGTCDVLGWQADGGEIEAGPALPARKLLFIGDSVTCGQGTEPQRAKEVANPIRANARLAFGPRLARTFGAQCHLVAYGGRGLIRDWQGNRTTTTAPQFYELALPDDPASAWDHARYVPDAIGVALGTNDFSRGIPDQNEFVNAYVEFVRKLQRDAPHAAILLIDSPILNDGPGEPPKRSALSAFLDEVVAKVRSPQVTHARIRHYAGAPDDAHPTGDDHAGIAAELAPAIRAALHW